MFFTVWTQCCGCWRTALRTPQVDPLFRGHWLRPVLCISECLWSSSGGRPHYCKQDSTMICWHLVETNRFLVISNLSFTLIHQNYPKSQLSTSHFISDNNNLCIFISFPSFFFFLFRTVCTRAWLCSMRLSITVPSRDPPSFSSWTRRTCLLPRSRRFPSPFASLSTKVLTWGMIFKGGGGNHSFTATSVDHTDFYTNHI